MVTPIMVDCTLLNDLRLITLLVDSRKFKVHNLREVLNEYNDFDYYNYGERLNYCIQASRGLRYLHSNGIIHMDMKPLNMLVSGPVSDIVIKLTDFNELSLLKDTCVTTITGNPLKGI